MPARIVQTFAFAFLLTLALPLHAQITPAAPMPATVTVHVAATGTQRIPPEVFGTFLEPIGNSINNGILAEILVNGSLESGLWNHTNLETLFREQPELITSTNDTGIPLPWFPLNPSAGNRYELHVGDAANSWQSLEILGTPAPQVGIAQKIYLPVQRELTYRVSLYAKHLSGATGLTVLIRDHDSGTVLAQSHIDAPDAAWKKYSTTLTLRAQDVRRLQAFDFGLAVDSDNHVDIDELSLTPADAIGIFDPDAIAMARAMHSTQLRFGGNFTSFYHWRDGIGPADKRPVMENIGWGIPEYNQLGTDEFLQLCDLLHAVPQFALNLGSGTPAEAADWVRYIHAHHRGRVIYELGNEIYGAWQVGYATTDQIAARTLAFSQAVRAVDPNAELIATGIGPVTDGKWNAQLLNLPPKSFSYLSQHFVIGTNRPALPAATPDFTAAAAYAMPFTVAEYLDKVQQQIDSYPDHRGNIHIAVTEWLFNSKGSGERNFTNESPSWMNEGGAVLAAGFFNSILRRPDSITLTDMTGLMEFAGIWKRREQIYAVPSYYVFQLYSAVAGDTLLPVTSNTGTYNVAGGVPYLGPMRNIPYIDVVATRSSDAHTLTLLCVNRALNSDVAVNFDLGPLQPTGPITVQQIAAASRYELNDEVEPLHIVPAQRTLPAPTSGPLSLTLPHESVTVLHIPLQN